MSRVRIVVVAIACGAGAVHAEPTPQKVDVKPFRDELLVFNDAANNLYVVRPPKFGDKTPARVWFGQPGKPLYEQLVIARSHDHAAWDVSTWAPRIPGVRPANFIHHADGSYAKTCGDQPPVQLTQLTGDKAKTVLDKHTLMTEFLQRRGHMLARDDGGTYYYVDRLSGALGGKSFRVFVGKKGAMKLLPLSDVASDTAGEVFSTKSGDLRLDRRADIRKMVWIRGEKRTELITLDVDANSSLIFSDLGIYPFLGTICDNM